MRNRTYGGVRGRKTKVGRKLLRFPPTRLYPFLLLADMRMYFFLCAAVNTVLNALLWCSSVLGILFHRSAAETLAFTVWEHTVKYFIDLILSFFSNWLLVSAWGSFLLFSPFIISMSSFYINRLFSSVDRLVNSLYWLFTMSRPTFHGMLLTNKGHWWKWNITFFFTFYCLLYMIQCLFHQLIAGYFIGFLYSALYNVYSTLFWGSYCISSWLYMTSSWRNHFGRS